MTTPHSPKVLILRLSNSRDTAASSTHRVLADLVCVAAPAAEIDFAFLPSKRAPRVAGHSSGRDWSAFDLVLVVNAFVQEVLNLPWLLHANGLSPWATARPDAFPPVLMGGSNAFASQGLVMPDGQAVPDVLFFGEAEDSLPEFIRRWLTSAGGKRERLAQAARGLDGFWVTGEIPCSPPIRQAVARSLATQSMRHPLPDVETSGTVRLSVGSGCAAFCSFCFEGYERKPYREFTQNEILTHARNLKISCGARVAELDAFNLNSYAHLVPLVEQCTRLFDKVSFKSQRADGIAACPEIIDLERAAGKSSFTLGIEGISARMRAFLCKSLSDQALSASLRALLDRRVRELKLFFILTAHETPEDLAAFGEFCAHLKGWLDAPAACTRVVLSFGRLVRMPNTPLVYDRLFLDEAEWRFCVDGVAAACRRAKLECRFAFDWPDYLGTQLLAACHHEDANAIVALACGGLSYHAPWRDQDANSLRATLQHLECRPRNANHNFPFVERVVAEAHLEKRWEDARQFIDGDYCLGSTCSGCGACADAAERGAITGHSRALHISSSAIEAIARIEADKRRLMPSYLRVDLPDDFAEHSAGWTAARLMQLLLERHPEQVGNLLAATECLFSAGENEQRLTIPSGETIIALKAWDSAISGQLVTDAPFRATPLQEAFVPGVFSRATWHIFSSTPLRETAQSASSWLTGLHLSHTLRRDGTAWRLDLAAAAIKKNAVYELHVRPEADGSCVCITFSAKACVHDLLARLQPLPGYPKVRCTSLTLP